jgi:hypothetical protein
MPGKSSPALPKRRPRGPHRARRVRCPAELRQIKLLNDAGNVLDVDRSYPGAAVQGHNLAARGALLAVAHGATAAGVAMAGPKGYIAGKFVGGMGTKALDSSLSKRAARKRIRKLQYGRLTFARGEGVVKAGALAPAYTRRASTYIFQFCGQGTCQKPCKLMIFMI